MSEETIKKIGAKLRDARQQKGLTQEEVAKSAGMGTTRYAVIERGQAKNITINKLEKIAKVLDLSLFNI